MRNVLLSGGIGHDFDATSAHLAQTLSAIGVESHVVDDLDRGAALIDRARVDLITVNCLRWQMLGERFADQRSRWAYTTSPRMQRALVEHLARGRGILAMHTAVICFDDWKLWPALLGARWAWGTSHHPPVGTVRVQVQPSEHCIVSGMRDFEVEDEVYCALDADATREDLLSTDVAGKAQPLLWARQVGGGRLVYDALGHGVASLSSKEHQTILQRSARWAMGLGAGGA